MTISQKFITKLLNLDSRKNIDFNDLTKFLKNLGFTERIKGDHFIFSKENVAEILNIQPNENNKAKSYQVKQVVDILNKYKML
ncbi:MAG: type II toxin-antitoxin system HicA family toxin [bacterium]|jgi:predicted RNA binding protein YcfA (HicA-like mRNA interferase family)|uniref:Type II toxin-antitoxin system HicA family toxin n=1 Tax=Candidatus Acididesulfobacter diazotrophicus TaxID=2597226 RepID=A0A519BP04_9DELT|nr:MAG: type II toxin-antitoxin system HicA family toxin [Candidatus Acididesulfobacter diazotrophicus]